MTDTLTARARRLTTRQRWVKFASSRVTKATIFLAIQRVSAKSTAASQATERLVKVGTIGRFYEYLTKLPCSNILWYK